MSEGLSKEGLAMPSGPQAQPPGIIRQGRSQPSPGEPVPTGLPTRKGTYSAQDGQKQAPCSHPWRDRRGLLWEGGTIGEEPGVLPGLSIFVVVVSFPYKFPGLLHT